MMIRLTVFLLGALIAVIAALSGCADPQVVQATDCRGAVQPCGIIIAPASTHAMTNVPVTVPVSAVP